MEITMALMAMVPILWLIVSMLGSFVKTWQAALAALILTLFLALLFWKMPLSHAASAILEGMALGLWPIGLVVVSAIFMYNLSVKSGGMEIIKQMLSGISSDRRIQVLVLAWGFGGFLEAISGYGTSVAIPASILIVLGFNPLTAAVVCLVANTVPTAFGAVGIAVTTLAGLTGLDAGNLSFKIALQLAPLIVIVPFVLVAVTSKGLKGLRGVWLITLSSGLSFVIPQLLAARFLGEQMPTLLGSLCSLLVTIGLNAVLNKKEPHRPKRTRVPLPAALKAWMPYLLILLMILLTSPLFTSLHQAVASVKSALYVYQGPHARPVVFQWLSFPGTLIFLSALISAAVSRISLKTVLSVLGATLRQMAFSLVTILSIVSLAKLMTYSGMINDLANMLVAATGSLFPLISPFIGMLGTFMTGSDTSSNILFGTLQQKAANAIGADPVWLASANTAGATAGKMISPQSIVVATSAAGIKNMEGKIFRKTLLFSLVYAPLISLIVFFGAGLL